MSPPEHTDNWDDHSTEIIRLSPELDHAISSILETKDPLDKTEFDPIDYINLLFPTEDALSQADTILTKLRQKIQLMNTDLSTLIRSQTSFGNQSKAELEETIRSIKTLSANIAQIKSQAAHSEQMVQEITRDIKSLDHAKRNLTFSITVLRRLQMLVSAIDQLRQTASKKSYIDTAQLLQVINQLMAQFKTYRSVNQIAGLLDSVLTLQNEIRKQIFGDFEMAFGSGGGLRSQIGVLSDACLVVNVLDGEVRKALVEWYCDLQLRDYRNIFRMNPEVAGLDDVSRRYAWLKRLLKTFDEEHAVVFPPEWKVAEVLCEKFCLDTRKDLSDVLAKSDNNMDVKVMLQALQTTMDFEGKVEKRFGGRSLDQEPHPDQPPSKFHRIISTTFEPYLHHYITTEDASLSTIIDQYRSRPVLQEATDEGVLSSSTDLFYLYRQTLVQCSKWSTGKPFLDLSRVLGKWLKVYAEILQQKLPKDESSKKGMTQDDIRTICLVVNTADYCAQTITQLEEALSTKISPEFKPLINYNNEHTTFITLSSLGLKILLGSIDHALDPALNILTKRNWSHSAIESVGDQSEWVTLVGQILTKEAGVVARYLGHKWWRGFCDKFVESFLGRVYGCVRGLRGVGEVGAEQLLLDTQSLKTILAHLPSISHPPTSNTPTTTTTYTKLLQKNVTKVEQLLKVVLRPVYPVEGIIETWVLLFGKGGEEGGGGITGRGDALVEFREILEIKGVKRGEMAGVLEAFQRRVGGGGGIMGGGGKPQGDQGPGGPGQGKFESGFRKFVAGMSRKG